MAEHDQPIRALRDALRAVPDSPALRRELASALVAAGEPEEALGHLEGLLARTPGDGAALLQAATCLEALGRPGEALARYRQAVDADLRLADATLQDRLEKAAHDPRARIRLVGGGAAPAEPAAPTSPDPEAPISFADVGGLEDLKEKLRLRVIYPLQRPDLWAAYGRRAGGGVLLYGPPGCGKTWLARATAGEAGLHFMSVGLDDVLDMWLGESEKRLHELFRTARERAPTVLFFDELDAIGARRSGFRNESYRTLVTQLLTELDGAASGARPGPGRGQSARTSRDLDGVLVLGATNSPWDVDAAFRRPGRFGEVLFVPPPDLRARVEILKLKLRGRPQEELDLVDLARRTELWSGADLGHLVDAACDDALRSALRAGPGGASLRPLTDAGLRAAAARIRPSTREWFATAKSFVAHANQAGQYDEVAEYLRRYGLA